MHNSHFYHNHRKNILRFLFYTYGYTYFSYETTPSSLGIFSSHAQQKQRLFQALLFHFVLFLFPYSCLSSCTIKFPSQNNHLGSVLSSFKHTKCLLVEAV